MGRRSDALLILVALKYNGKCRYFNMLSHLSHYEHTRARSHGVVCVCVCVCVSAMVEGHCERRTLVRT